VTDTFFVDKFLSKKHTRQQFPGIKFGGAVFSIDFSGEKDADFTYEDKKYRIRYYGNSSIDTGNSYRFLRGAAKERKKDTQ
jgi:hypothetical protein